MDPFEVRMQFLSLLRRLNASQQSIQKVVTYALKYFSRCGEDLWDCVVEECQQGSLNTRINILYLLDSLCETSLLSKATSGSSSSFYVDFVARDLATIVDYVVPEGREGLINLMSAVQILENWRTKRVIDPQKIEDVLAKLDAQKAAMHAAAVNTSTAPTSASVPNANTNTAGSDAASISNAPGPAGAGGESLTFSRNEIFKRIEEDRERHKRLRERRWVQPVSHAFSQPLLASFAPTSASSVSTSASTSAGVGTSTGVGTGTGTGTGIDTGTDAGGAPNTEEPPLDIEFDNEWETTSEWNEDDEEAVMEENALCYPNAATRLGPASVSASASASAAAAVSSVATVPSVSCTPAPGRERDIPRTESGSDSTPVQLSKRERERDALSTSAPGPGPGPAPTTPIPTSTPASAVTSMPTPTPTAPKKRVRIDRTRMHAAERRE